MINVINPGDSHMPHYKSMYSLFACKVIVGSYCNTFSHLFIYVFIFYQFS